MGVNVGVGVAVPVGGTGVCVAVRMEVDGITVCMGGVRQPASSENTVHRIIHFMLGSLDMH
jgi:hypothetical protein